MMSSKTSHLLSALKLGGEFGGNDVDDLQRHGRGGRASSSSSSSSNSSSGRGGAALSSSLKTSTGAAMPTMPINFPMELVDDDDEDDSGNMKSLLVKLHQVQITTLHPMASRRTNSSLFFLLGTKAKGAKESAEKRKKAQRLVTEASGRFERKLAADAEAFQRNWDAKVEDVRGKLERVRIRTEEGQAKLCAERKAALATMEVQRDGLKEVLSKLKGLQGELMTLRDGDFKERTERETARAKAEVEAKLTQLEGFLAKVQCALAPPAGDTTHQPPSTRRCANAARRISLTRS